MKIAKIIGIGAAGYIAVAILRYAVIGGGVYWDKWISRVDSVCKPENFVDGFNAGAELGYEIQAELNETIFDPYKRVYNWIASKL